MQRNPATFSAKIEFKKSYLASYLAAIYPMKTRGQYLTLQIDNCLSRFQTHIVTIYDINQPKLVSTIQESIKTKDYYGLGLKTQILAKYKSEICEGFISKEECFLNSLWTQESSNHQKCLLETSAIAVISNDEAIVAKPRNLLSMQNELIRRDVLVYYKDFKPTETNLILTDDECINKIEVISPFKLLIQNYAGQLQILRRSKTRPSVLSKNKCLITIKEDAHKLGDFTALQENEILMLYNALDEKSIKFHIYDIKKCQSIRSNSYIQDQLGVIENVIPLQEKFFYLIEFVYKMAHKTVCLLNALTMEIIPLISQSDYNLVGLSADRQLLFNNKSSFVLYQHPLLEKALSLRKKTQQQIQPFFYTGISKIISEYIGNDVILNENNNKVTVKI